MMCFGFGVPGQGPQKHGRLRASIETLMSIFLGALLLGGGGGGEHQSNIRANKNLMMRVLGAAAAMAAGVIW